MSGITRANRGHYRGCRAGSHRRIPNIITDRPAHLPHRTPGVNVSNLAAVPPVSHVSTATLTLLNARSVRNKTSCLSEYVVDKAVDFLAVTDTLLSSATQSAVINDLCPDSYCFLSVPREIGTYGGVGLLHRTTYNVERRSLTTQVRTFELMTVTIKGHRLVHLVVLYRPLPSSAKWLQNDHFPGRVSGTCRRVDTSAWRVDHRRGL